MNENERELLNKILSLATNSPEFRNKLLTEPVAALEKFELSEKAKRIIIDTIYESLNQ